MRIFLLGLALAACNGQEPKSPIHDRREPSGVIVRRKVPPVGRVSTVTIDTKLDWDELTMRQPGNEDSGSSKSHNHTKRREEVLATSAERPTKLRVTYLERTSTRDDKGTQRTSALAVQGNTYVIELHEGAAHVTGTASPAEVKLVQADFKQLAVMELNETIPDRPLMLGDPVRELEAGLRARLEAGTKVETVKVTLAPPRPGLVAFDIRAQAALTIWEGAPVALDLSGEYVVRAEDGWDVELTYRGPMKVKGTSTLEDGTAIQIEGKGTMEKRTLVTYP
jgi:hypothetical protein